MARGLNLHSSDGVIARDPSGGILLAYGSSVPGAIAGYAPGCKFIRISAFSIGTVSYINVGTKTTASFVNAGLIGAVSVNFIYGEALPLDAPFFVADRSYTIQSLIVRPLVAGTDASAVTAQVRKASSGTAIASGTVVHSSTINLKGTIDTNQSMTIVAADRTVTAGQAVGLDVTGTTTAARGVVSMLLLPA